MYLDIDKEQFGTPDHVVVTPSANGAHILFGQILTCPEAIIPVEDYQMSGYVEAAMALHCYAERVISPRRYTAVFEEVEPKKKPKTYGPPKIGKRGKITKW